MAYVSKSSIDPRRLLTFRTVAHERSFSRAAERLSLSQPSVSHQIALLETELGSRLFERARGGLRLTAPGAVLLEHADEIAWRLQLADRQIATLTGERQRQARVGCFPTAMASFIPAAVTRLRHSTPELHFLLSEVTTQMLEARLLSGDFDIALGYQDSSTERREIRGVQRIDLFRETFYIGLPAGHPLAGTRRPIRLSELADEDWVVPSAEGFLTRSCRDAGFEPKIIAISQDPIATRGLISRGLAVGWVPGLLIEDYGDVVIRAVDGLDRTRDIYALLPPGDRHPLTHAIIDALSSAAADFDLSPADR